jgi:hypothetical protein
MPFLILSSKVFLVSWLENYQMGTTWEEGLIGGLPK